MHPDDLKRNAIYLERSFGNITDMYYNGTKGADFVDAMRIGDANGNYVDVIKGIKQDAEVIVSECDKLNCTLYGFEYNTRFAREKAEHIIICCNREIERHAQKAHQEEKTTKKR